MKALSWWWKLWLIRVYEFVFFFAWYEICGVVNFYKINYFLNWSGGVKEVEVRVYLWWRKYWKLF